MAEIARTRGPARPAVGSVNVAIAIIIICTVLLSSNIGFSLFYLGFAGVLLISVVNYEWNIAAMLVILHFAGTVYEPMYRYASTGRWVLIFMLAIKFALPMAEKGKRTTVTGFQIGFLLFCMIAILSTMDAEPHRTSLYRAISLWFLFFSVFVSLWNFMDSREKVERFIRTFVYITGMMIYLSIVYNYTGTIRGVMQGRFKGFYVNPNTLGLIVTMQLPFAYWLADNKKYSVGTWRKIHWAIFGMTVYALVMSGSRAAMLGVMIGAITYMSFRYKSRTMIYMALFLTIAGAGYGLVREGIESAFFQDVVYRKRSIDEGSGRMDLWGRAIKLSKMRPVLGFGFGTSEFAIGTMGKRKRMKKDPHGVHTHNSFLRLLVELGWVGMSFAFVFLVSLFRTIPKLMKKAKSWELQHLVMILTATIVASLVDSIFESWALSVGCVLAMPFWICVMLIYRMEYSVEDYDEKTDIPPAATTEGAA